MAVTGSPWLGGPLWCCCDIEQTVPETCVEMRNYDWPEVTITVDGFASNDCMPAVVVLALNGASFSGTPVINDNRSVWYQIACDVDIEDCGLSTWYVDYIELRFGVQCQPGAFGNPDIGRAWVDARYVDLSAPADHIFTSWRGSYDLSSAPFPFPTSIPILSHIGGGTPTCTLSWGA